MKLRYIGVMGFGTIKGVGPVKKGNTYNVEKQLANKLLNTTNLFETVETEVFKKKKEKMVDKEDISF